MNTSRIRHLPRSTRVTAVALLGCALAFALELFELGADPDVLTVLGAVLVAAGLTATGWRWTPLIGAAAIATILANNPFLVHNLSHPENLLLFASTGLNVCCAAVAVVAGVTATVRNYRKIRVSSSSQDR